MSTMSARVSTGRRWEEDEGGGGGQGQLCGGVKTAPHGNNSCNISLQMQHSHWAFQAQALKQSPNGDCNGGHCTAKKNNFTQCGMGAREFNHQAHGAETQAGH